MRRRRATEGYEIPDKGPIPAKAGPKLPVFRHPYKPDLAAQPAKSLNLQSYGDSHSRQAGDYRHLAPCPFCGCEMEAQWDRHNPKARCRTEGCKAGSLPVLNLDRPDDIAAWNRRASQPSGPAAGCECAERATPRAPGSFVNDAGILASDGPGEVVKKLDAAFTRNTDIPVLAGKQVQPNRSDGSTASYYELPAGAAELQHLIAHRNMNAQIGEIFRTCYRYGIASHSDQLRDAKKILFYARAEVERLEALEGELA